MINNLNIRHINQESFENIQYLMQVSLGVKVPIEKIQHKYTTSQYCDHEYIATIGFVDDQVVGFYGVLPWPVRRNGQTVYLGQTCDSYTHPDFQKQGVHYQLAQAAYDNMKQLGYKGVWAFHSENTYQSCKKLGWSLLHNFRRVEIKVSTPPFFKVLSKYSFLKEMKKRQIKRGLKHFNSKQEFLSHHPKNCFHIDYSSEFVAYKNRFDCEIIHLHGVSLWIRFDYVVNIAAVSGLTKDKLEIVITDLKNLAKSIGAPKIIFQLHPQDPANQILEKCGETFESFIVGGMSFDPSFNMNDVWINYIDMDSVL